MSTLSIRLPNSLHRQVRQCAEREGTSINQLIASAVAEKLAALMTVDYLEARAKRGSRKRFEAVLRGIPDVEPEPFDRLPVKASTRGSRRGQKTKKHASPVAAQGPGGLLPPLLATSWNHQSP